MKLFNDEMSVTLHQPFSLPKDIRKEAKALTTLNKSIVLLEKLDTLEIYDRHLYDTTINYISEDLGFPKDTKLSVEGLRETAKKIAMKLWLKLKEWSTKISVHSLIAFRRLSNMAHTGIALKNLTKVYGGLEKTIQNSELTPEEKDILLKEKFSHLDFPHKTNLVPHWETLYKGITPAGLFKHYLLDDAGEFRLEMNGSHALFNHNSIIMKDNNTLLLPSWTAGQFFDNIQALGDKLVHLNDMNKEMLTSAKAAKGGSSVEFASKFTHDVNAIYLAYMTACNKAFMLNNIVNSVGAKKVLDNRPKSHLNYVSY